MKILNCPICGFTPETSIFSLDRGNGHGYPGNYGFRIECPKCKLIPTSTEYDINMPMEKAKQVATRSWNNQVNRILKFLEHREEKKNE